MSNRVTVTASVYVFNYINIASAFTKIYDLIPTQEARDVSPHKKDEPEIDGVSEQRTKEHWLPAGYRMQKKRTFL